MAGSKRKKQQSRLAFTPIPSSSPAASSYNAQVRDRAARVGIEPSPSPAKRRKVKDVPSAKVLKSSAVGGDTLKGFPPTPDHTAPRPENVETISDGNDSDAVNPSGQRMSARKRMKQKKLHFDSSPPMPSNSRQSLNMAPPIRATPFRPSQHTPKAGFFGTQRPITVDTSDEEDQDSGTPEDDASLPETIPFRKWRHKREGPRILAGLEQDEMPGTTAKAPHQPRSVDSDKDEDEEGDDVKEVNQGQEQQEEDDDDDEPMPTTPAARRRRKLPRHPEPDDGRAGNSSPTIPADDEEEDDSDDVVITGSRTRGKRKAVSRSSEDDSPAEAPRSRKRLRQMNPISEEEQQDIEDDLRDLASSGSDSEIRPSQKKKKNVRAEALARLKRKREGAAIQISDDEASDEEVDVYIYEDLDSHAASNGGEEEMDDDEEEEVILPPRLARRQMFDADEEDDSFVIDDEDDALGVPSHVPIEFTRYASMKAKDLFRYAIDWMVQKKINPAFSINDEIYDLAFKKLDDEVKGLAGSKFTSAAWTPEFTCTLEARPELDYGRIDRASSAHFLRDKCDACNRSGHPATYEVRFEGRPYHHITLEHVAHGKGAESSDSELSSDSESDHDGDASEVDAKGRHIAPQHTIFYLGKFCMSNAKIAHSLNHWRFHLFEWVVEYLNKAGYNAPEKIVKRDGWSTRKRQKFANKIVDCMQTDGKIKELYRDFKGEIDAARNSKQGRYGGDSP